MISADLILPAGTGGGLDAFVEAPFFAPPLPRPLPLVTFAVVVGVELGAGAGMALRATPLPPRVGRGTVVATGSLARDLLFRGASISDSLIGNLSDIAPASARLCAASGTEADEDDDSELAVVGRRDELDDDEADLLSVRWSIDGR